MSDEQRILEGIRVIDGASFVAAPAAALAMADFGADVIKIEAPDGVDPNAGMSGARHGYDMLNLHRNKRSMTLNLKEADGRALFMDLVKSADVVVENFRPDVKDRLGISYDDLRAVNPRIVLASISGFGQTGPYAKRAGFDQIAQGMGGLMGVTGFEGEGPVRAGTAVADLSAGMNAATGILVALYERASSGEGQWVQTSLLESQIGLMDFQAARYLVEGEVPAQAGNDHPYVTPMGVVKTRDGFLNLGVGGDGQWRAFCGVIDRPDLAEHPDFATNDERFKRRSLVWDMLAPIFAEATTAEWMERLEAGGVPAGPIYRMDEVFADPQVEHLGMAAPICHPARGETRVVALPITLSRTPAAVSTASPDAGQHTDDILSDLGIDADRIADLRARNVI